VAAQADYASSADTIPAEQSALRRAHEDVGEMREQLIAKLAREDGYDQAEGP